MKVWGRWLVFLVSHIEARLSTCDAVGVLGSGTNGWDEKERKQQSNHTFSVLPFLWISTSAACSWKLFFICCSSKLDQKEYGFAISHAPEFFSCVGHFFGETGFRLEEGATSSEKKQPYYVC